MVSTKVELPETFKNSPSEVRSSHRRCSVRKGNSQENICARVSFLKNFMKKETLAQVFSCEFCEISKNTFFTEHLWAAASEKCSMKNLFRKISQTSEENIFIEVVICQDAGLELATLSEKRVQHRCLAVKFLKFLKTASCRTTENGFFWTFGSVLGN